MVCTTVTHPGTHLIRLDSHWNPSSMVADINTLVPAVVKGHEQRIEHNWMFCSISLPRIDDADGVQWRWLVLIMKFVAR
jgi:hypothetical protein